MIVSSHIFITYYAHIFITYSATTAALRILVKPTRTSKRIRFDITNARYISLTRFIHSKRLTKTRITFAFSFLDLGERSSLNFRRTKILFYGTTIGYTTVPPTAATWGRLGSLLLIPHNLLILHNCTHVILILLLDHISRISPGHHISRITSPGQIHLNIIISISTCSRIICIITK